MPQFACATTPRTTFCPSFFRASTLSFLSVQQILNTFYLFLLAPPPPPVVTWVRGSMVEAGVKGAGFLVGRGRGFWQFRANNVCPMICSVVFCSAVFLNVLPCDLSPVAVVLQAEKVLLFSQDTNLTSLLLEAKDLEARVIILSARFV